MAEHASTTDAAGQAAVDDAAFGRDELVQFARDDSTAGGAIGKMLALFFFYTVVAMSIVGWWTYKSVSQ